MNLLRIALLQILPQGSLEENRQKGICACIEAKKAGADIALFPEMWSNGYHVPEYPDRLRLESIPAAGEFVLDLWQVGGAVGCGHRHHISGAL